MNGKYPVANGLATQLHVSWYMCIKTRPQEWVGVHLQECIAPLMEALITIFLLFRVGSACLVQPIFEQFFILLQHQVLAQYYIGLVKTLVCQAFAQDFTNPCQLSHKFLPHWLTNKVAVLL